MKNLTEVRTAVENLPRYKGTKWTNGPETWSLAFCKKMDSLTLLSADLADDVIAVDLIDKIKTGDLRRGDLILRRWAGGRNSIDVVAEVRPAPTHDSLGKPMGGHYVLTTASGGNFRTLSQMWTTGDYEERIDVARPMSIISEEIAAVDARIAESEAIVAEIDVRIDTIQATDDETDRFNEANYGTETADYDEVCPLCGESLASSPNGSLVEDADGDVYHEPCIDELFAETDSAVSSLSTYDPVSEGDVVRFVADYSTGVLVDGGPTAPAGYEAVVEEVGDLDGDGFPMAILVRFPETDFGFSPRQYVPATVLEVVQRFADMDLDSADEPECSPESPCSSSCPSTADEELEALLWEGAPADEVGPFDDVCRHDGDRSTVSYEAIGGGRTHELVCPSCGHVFFELQLVTIRDLRPGDVFVSNEEENLLPPYWVVEKILPSRYDDDFVLFASLDHPDGEVRRRNFEAPSCLIVAVKKDLHEVNRKRATERSHRIADSLALAVFSTDSYHDGSGDWEVEALVRDFRNAGGSHAWSDDSIETAIEVKFESLRDQVARVARDLMAASVYEAVLSAAPRPFSAVWADALVRVNGEIDRTPPTAKFLSEARTQVLASKGR